MAGLLDIFNTLEGQQALGLLAAGGPQTDPSQTGFGQRMASGLGMAENWKQRQAHAEMEKQKMALQGMQMQNYASEIEQRKAALEQTQQKQEMLSKLFGGGISPGAFTPSADGMGPTMPPSMQQQSGIGGLDINKIAQLKAQHGIDLMEPFKWANDPLKMEQGSTYKDRMSGQERYMPKVGEGVAPNAGGFYGELPGYGAAQAGIEGAKAGAVERAKASLDPYLFTPKGESNPRLTNRAAAMAPQPGVMGSGYAGGSRDAANADSIAMLNAELQNPKYDPATKAGIQREIGRLQQQSGMQSGGVELQSEAEKASLVDTAKAGVVRDTAKIVDQKRYGQLQSTANRSIELLKQGPTNSGAGAGVDAVANFFGQSTKGADVAAQLSTLSGWMTSNVPRMEGPQSDRDTQQYQIMAAAVGDKTKPVPQRMAAAKELLSLQEKYAALNGGSTDGATGDFGDKPKAALMDKMPTANASNKGRKIRDTETGKVLTSNGLSWIEAK